MSPLFHTNHSSRSVSEVVRQFFKEDDWKTREVGDTPILQMGFSGKSGNWTCFAQPMDEKEQFVFYSRLESKAPEDKRQAVSEFVTRANYGLVMGNFELDYSDGEVRFKTSIDVEGGELTTKMVQTLVYTNVLMMDRYLPGLMSVMYAGVSPAEAIAKIEG